MKGGKRKGSGRPKGPPKVRLITWVLPATLRELGRRAISSTSLGAVLDKLMGTV